mmetsp:Transcript_71938/g.150331  ORF Transcript_71938/g.150331 Transcript_71938/m.150331 type:complete len:200 (+) Transcript_71938:513-1112(+)
MTRWFTSTQSQSRTTTPIRRSIMSNRRPNMLLRQLLLHCKSRGRRHRKRRLPWWAGSRSPSRISTRLCEARSRRSARRCSNPADPQRRRRPSSRPYQTDTNSPPTTATTTTTTSRGGVRTTRIGEAPLATLAWHTRWEGTGSFGVTGMARMRGTRAPARVGRAHRRRSRRTRSCGRNGSTCSRTTLTLWTESQRAGYRV